jgi:hypothetical protein
MSTERLTDEVKELSQNVKDYVNLRITLLKITITEKLSRVLTFLVLVFFTSLFVLLFSMFICFTLVYLYGEYIGPLWQGALIVAAIILLKAVLLYVFRRKLILDPIVRFLSRVFLEEQINEEDEL